VVQTLLQEHVVMSIASRAGSLFARCFGFVVVVLASGNTTLNAQQTTLRGQATNESMRPWVTAEIQFTLTANGDGKGNLTVRPPLYGSGVAHALFRRDTLVITTTDVNGGTIVWSGSIRGDSVVGRYVILTKQNAGQEGNWAAVRTGGPPLLNRSGQVGAQNAEKANAVQSQVGKPRAPDLGSFEAVTAAVSARQVEAWSTQFIQIKRGAIVTPDIDWEDRVRSVRELAARPIGREALVDILVTDLPKAVIAGTPQPAGSRFERRVVEQPELSYDTAIRLGWLMFDVLSRSPSPSEAAKQKVKDASVEIEKQKPNSQLFQALSSLHVAWSKPRSAESEPSGSSVTCMDAATPSTTCITRWIDGLTAPEANLTGLCMKQVAGMAASGIRYDLGGRSDDEDNQLAMQICKDGNAFVISRPYHAKIRSSAPRQFARMQEAYRIGSRVKLIFF
jgi:hypothetical protein